MLWGHLSCLICDESINRNGSLTCQCTPTTLYRNLPVAPITSQERLSSNPASKDPQSLDEKEFTTDLIRCNKEKLAYDQALDLDEEIKTVYEDQGDFHIGDKSIAPMGSGSEDVRRPSNAIELTIPSHALLVPIPRLWIYPTHTGN